MSRIVYVNGHYRPYGEAAVHAEDRGFQFADAVYEVIEVRDGHLVDETRHMDRLARSLSAISIPPPMSRPALAHVMREVVRRNRVRHGTVYLQVSRGAAPREFLFPTADLRPTVVCLARASSQSVLDARAAEGISVVSTPDIRWGRCDIKTVMLLPACLAKTDARDSGAREAWLVDADGFVTEGASSNAWIVTDTGELVTRPASSAILAGVTRATVIDALAHERMQLAQRPFRLTEALAAQEAFITAASNIVMPVVRIDGAAIGDGRPGPIALRLRAVFHEIAERASR